MRDIGALGTGAKPSALANPDLAPALGRLSAYRGDRGVRAFSAIDQALVALDREAGPLAATLIGGITAIGGGLLRDVLAGQVPEVLRRELYAVPALAGAPFAQS